MATEKRTEEQKAAIAAKMEEILSARQKSVHNDNTQSQVHVQQDLATSQKLKKALKVYKNRQMEEAIDAGMTAEDAQKSFAGLYELSDETETIEGIECRRINIAPGKLQDFLDFLEKQGFEVKVLKTCQREDGTKVTIFSASLDPNKLSQKEAANPSVADTPTAAPSDSPAPEGEPDIEGMPEPKPKPKEGATQNTPSPTVSTPPAPEGKPNVEGTPEPKPKEGATQNAPSPSNPPALEDEPNVEGTTESFENALGDLNHQDATQNASFQTRKVPTPAVNNSPGVEELKPGATAQSFQHNFPEEADGSALQQQTSSSSPTCAPGGASV